MDLKLVTYKLEDWSNRKTKSSFTQYFNNFKVILIFFALISQSTYGLEYLDADNTDQAMSMVAVEAEVIDRKRVYCGKKFPNFKRHFDFYAYFWTQNNKVELESIESYRENTPGEKFTKIVNAGALTSMKLVEIAGLAKSEAICTSFLEGLKSGNDNVEKKTPKAAKFLKKYKAETPINTIKTDMYNFYHGCVKAGINKEIDYDYMVAYCNCGTEVQFNSLTEEERKELDKLARSGANIGSHPNRLKIQSSLRNCAEKNRHILKKISN